MSFTADRPLRLAALTQNVYLLLLAAHYAAFTRHLVKY